VQSERVTIGFGFTSDWLRKWFEVSTPITKRSNATPKKITFNLLLFPVNAFFCGNKRHIIISLINHFPFIAFKLIYPVSSLFSFYVFYANFRQP
jgi:hypothetical protein